MIIYVHTVNAITISNVMKKTEKMMMKTINQRK